MSKIMNFDIVRKIVAIGGNGQISQRLENIFAGQPFKFFSEENLESLLERFKTEAFNIALLVSSACRKYQKEAFLQILDNLSRKNPLTRFVFLVEAEDIDFAMEAIKAGAFEYTKLP